MLLYLQEAGAVTASDSVGSQLVIAAILAVIIASQWRVFARAGEPGWAAIVPIYNFFVAARIAGRPGWWVLFVFVPFVNLFVFASIGIGIAHRFGRGTGFGIGLAFLPWIFFPLLAFASTPGQEDQIEPNVARAT